MHVAFSVGPASFGLGSVVLNLAREQRDRAITAEVWCTDTWQDVDWASGSSGVPVATIRHFPVVGPRRLAFSPAMERAAKETQSGDVAVVHQHGLWAAPTRAVGLLRARLGVPVVVAAHGYLQPWALGRSRGKKWLAGVLYEHAGLRHAACLHAVAEPEVKDYRDFGLTNPIAVIPNGIDRAWLDSAGDGASFRKIYGIEPGRRMLLFLSRITPKKGLLLALHALAARRKEFMDWVFVIAGADEFGHKTEVEALACQLAVDGQVRFVGRLDGQPKRDAFAAAELFILPSFSEGAPLVVLEALATGLPVLTTRATPWQDLERHACGWWVEATYEGVEDGLLAATAQSPEVLKQMGDRGRALVAASYTWSLSADMTVQLYDWLRGRGDRPEFVVTK
jgi:glycosyltransferase involved in cell wall biosynthesis